VSSTPSPVVLSPSPTPDQYAMAREPQVESNASRFQLLARALDSQGLSYCQLKAIWRRSSEGEIDLLVDGRAALLFRSVAQELGFRSVLPPHERAVPGTESFLGYEPVSDRPLRLHVHYRLIVGDFWRTVYRLPVEEAVLQSSSQPGEPFKLPAPTYQFLLYVVRMMLRLRSWPLPVTEARWLAGIQGQLDYLEARSDRDALSSILARHLPILDLQFLDRCLHALRRECDPAESAAIRRELHRRLYANARRPHLTALLAALGEKVLPLQLCPMLSHGRMRSSRGGLLLALIGGHEVARSICARQIHRWLSGDVPTFRADLGQPPRSLLTLLTEGGLKLQENWYRLRGRAAPAWSYLGLLCHVSNARDRYRLYRRASRFATAGGIAICDRHPLHQDGVLVGPGIPELVGPSPKAPARRLGDAEAWYYRSILPPDVVLEVQSDASSSSDEVAQNLMARLWALL
jgi:hypothetical protein